MNNMTHARSISRLLGIPVAIALTIGVAIAPASASLIAHYDASNITQADGTTPATPTDGQHVAIWPTGPNWYDLSASNNDLAGGVNDPIYHDAGPEIINGDPAVAFRGGNFLTDSNGLGFSGNQAHTIFVVTRLDSTSWNTLFLFSNDLNVQNEGYSFYQSSANTVRMEGGFGDNLEFTLGASFRGTPIIIELRYDGTTWNAAGMDAYLNGAAQTITGGSGNALNFSAEAFRLGEYFARGTSFDLGEFRVYNTALTDAERNAVGAELETKWGISGDYEVVPEPSTVLLLVVGGAIAYRKLRSN
jgi:hypothetical protein